MRLNWLHYVWLHTYAVTGIRRSIAEYVLEQFTSEYFCQQVADPDKTLLTLRADDHLLGLAQINHAAPCPCDCTVSCEVERLYVQPHFMRQGAGTAFLAEAMAYARAGRQQKLWLTAYRGNENALAFYRAKGFRQAGRTVFEFGGEQHENVVLLSSG